MSGFTGSTPDDGAPFSSVGFIGEGSDSPLMKMLSAESILPGHSPSYQLCKLIYCYHVLGAKIVESPIKLAMSQRRIITVPGGPESRLVDAFNREWSMIGGRDSNSNDISADTIILNTMSTSRTYGIASLIMGERGSTEDTSSPINLDKIADADLYFNILDPLNTAGSLVLDQDPNSPDFQKAKAVRIGECWYHPSRCVIQMNERPVYIDYTDSAFGFVGRSVYQRVLFPLKTFLQTMITDQYVAIKVGLLIAKMQTPGPIVGNRVMKFFAGKRQNLKGGVTGNVLGIGIEEGIESLNFQNLEGPAAMVRDNALKNIAMGAGMPSKLLEEEEMVGGMAEGTEDAKRIAAYIETVRGEMSSIYRFFDRIVMRRAWSPAFYKTIQKTNSEFEGVPYQTALMKWMNSFNAVWPNLLEEPESEKMKTEEIRFKSAVALVEAIAPMLKNKESLVEWIADEVNSRKDLFSAKLEIDSVDVASLEDLQPQNADSKEPKPGGFGSSK